MKIFHSRPPDLPQNPHIWKKLVFFSNGRSDRTDGRNWIKFFSQESRSTPFGAEIENFHFRPIASELYIYIATAILGSSDETVRDGRKSVL